MVSITKSPIEHKGNIALEMIIYAVLVAGYFTIVLKFFIDPLVYLSGNSSSLYAVVALALIVGQGFLLEKVSRSIIEHVGKWGVG